MYQILYKKRYFYKIINLKYSHLTLAFLLQNIHLEFITCSHKFKLLMWTEKAGFKEFDVKILIIIRFVSKQNKYVLNVKTTFTKKRIASLEYVFIVSC